jgi:hypothetical protein
LSLQRNNADPATGASLYAELFHELGEPAVAGQVKVLTLFDACGCGAEL